MHPAMRATKRWTLLEAMGRRLASSKEVREGAPGIQGFVDLMNGRTGHAAPIAVGAALIAVEIGAMDRATGLTIPAIGGDRSR